MKYFGIPFLLTVVVLGGCKLTDNLTLKGCPNSPSSAESEYSAWSNCKGTAELPNGKKYSGQFVNGKANGWGTYIGSTGNEYTGEFKNWKRIGDFTVVYTNGDRYEGAFQAGKKNGVGILEYANGDKYTGEYKDGQRNGTGKLVFSNGDIYEGHFRSGKYHGRGTYIFTEGGSYFGGFWEGKRHGRGTLILSDGEKYVGEFENDKANGQFSIAYADESHYSGRMKDGKRDGVGTYIFPNGDRFIGEFKAGKRHGRGVIRYAKGGERGGVWEQGKFARLEVPPPPPPSTQKPEQSETSSTGSGFFISNSGHVVTNNHVIDNCTKITIGDSEERQFVARLLETDKRNDIALLRISSDDYKITLDQMKQKYGSTEFGHLIKSDKIELGEKVLVAGYPYGSIFSSTIKVTGGIVSANRGFGDNLAQFQIDAALQPGNSGGPIYDEYGNVLGAAVSQLDKLKMAEKTGSLPENVNFGIKSSTIRHFLAAAELRARVGKRSKSMSTKEIAAIASRQTVMVICQRGG